MRGELVKREIVMEADAESIERLRKEVHVSIQL